MDTDKVFFMILRAGLWEQDEGLSVCTVDWESIYNISREQGMSVIVADGISVMKKNNPALAIPSDVQSLFLHDLLRCEVRNRHMNETLSHLCKSLNDDNIQAIILKGQGTALNYAHPIHRIPGDIDFLLYGEDYARAASIFISQAQNIEKENIIKKHLAMFIDDVEVEIHGTIRVDFGKKDNAILDDMQRMMFTNRDFRVWNCNGTEVFLPSADFDAVFIFMHFVQHFYHGGLGLRQICDWTMHLSRFAGDIDIDLLSRRISLLRMDREWRVFGWIAVNMLGLQRDKMPLYDDSYSRTAEVVWNSIRMSGNFGRKYNAGRTAQNEPYLYRKLKSFSLQTKWMSRHLCVSVPNTVKVYCTMLSKSTKTVLCDLISPANSYSSLLSNRDKIK